MRAVRLRRYDNGQTVLVKAGGRLVIQQAGWQVLAVQRGCQTARMGGATGEQAQPSSLTSPAGCGLLVQLFHRLEPLELYLPCLFSSAACLSPTLDPTKRLNQTRLSLSLSFSPGVSFCAFHRPAYLGTVCILCAYLDPRQADRQTECCPGRSTCHDLSHYIRTWCHTPRSTGPVWSTAWCGSSAHVSAFLTSSLQRAHEWCS